MKPKIFSRQRQLKKTRCNFKVTWDDVFFSVVVEKLHRWAGNGKLEEILHMNGYGQRGVMAQINPPSLPAIPTQPEFPPEKPPDEIPPESSPD